MRRWSVLLLSVFIVIGVVAMIVIAPKTTNNIEDDQKQPILGLEDSIFDDESTDESEENREENKEENKEEKQEVVEEQKTEQKPSGEQQGAQSPDKENSNDDKQEGTVVTKMDYASFVALSPEKQQEYMESFESIVAFFDWYNAEKDKYEKEHPSIEVGNGEVDLNKVVGGN